MLKRAHLHDVDRLTLLNITLKFGLEKRYRIWLGHQHPNPFVTNAKTDNLNNLIIETVADLPE